MDAPFYKLPTKIFRKKIMGSDYKANHTYLMLGEIPRPFSEVIGTQLDVYPD
jgi:hypothetical protein